MNKNGALLKAKLESATDRLRLIGDATGSGRKCFLRRVHARGDMILTLVLLPVLYDWVEHSAAGRRSNTETSRPML